MSLLSLRHRVEYAGAWCALAAVKRLPPGAVLALARGVGLLAYRLLAKRRKTAISNLLKTKTAKDVKEAARMARESFAAISLTVAESLIVPPMLDRGDLPSSAVEIVFPEETRALVETTQSGIIVVSSHLGNWELGAKIAARFRKVTGIARRMNNPMVQRLIEKTKIREGFETIDKHDANPLKIARVLRKGGALAMLVDQHAHGEKTVLVDFLSLPARTYTTPAFLQHVTGAPIVICTAVRLGKLKFRLEFSPPLYYSFSKDTLDADILDATQDISRKLEEKIRLFPEQYLWAHNRWRS